ncbi:MAG: hypothetical protein WCH46_03780 [bacterium]
MLDSKEREAHLLQARERLARAFARFEGLITAMPERLRALESTRDKSQNRVKEIEALLERERAIAEQRQSLAEGTSDELQTLISRNEKLEEMVGERDELIESLEARISHQQSELEANQKAHLESLNHEEKLLSEISVLRNEHAGIVRQLELLLEEREHLQTQLAETEKRDSSFALTFTQDERLGLLKTIDTLIERVDGLAHIQN